MQAGGSLSVTVKSPWVYPVGLLRGNPTVCSEAMNGGSNTNNCSSDAWYVTPTCPTVVRLASRIGSVGLTCLSSSEASSSAPGPFCNRARTCGSLVAS